MSVVSEMRKRQPKFSGHVMRKDQMEHLVTIGKISGKRFSRTMIKTCSRCMFPDLGGGRDVFRHFRFVVL